MSGTTVIFVLDELRRRRVLAAKQEEGKAPEWGVMMAFGPGITIETMVLRAPTATLEGN
jgi:predicted naringenin-chalcone synthase